MELAHEQAQFASCASVTSVLRGEKKDRLVFDRLEPVAGAYRSYFQVQWCVSRMSAIFHLLFFGLLRSANLHEDGIVVAFTEMRAQTALTFLNV